MLACGPHLPMPSIRKVNCIAAHSACQLPDSKMILEGICADAKENQTIKFGPMCLNLPTVQVLHVFPKEDAQCDALRWATEKLQFEALVARNHQEALDLYSKKMPMLVFVDTRHPDIMDPLQVCRLIRELRGSQFTCIIGVVKKSLAEKEEASVYPLIRAGFNRWFLESCNLGICLNELIQLEHNEINTQFKLRAAQALFTALDFCKESVVVTGPNHDIQFVNQASERVLGFSAPDVIGKNAQDLYKVETVRRDVIESLTKHLRKGKEWESSLSHRKKSADVIPFWSRVSPVEIQNGYVDHLVYIKDYPHYLEKSLSTDHDMISYGNLKTLRKTSCDVKSLCGENNQAAAMNRRQSFAKFHALTIEAPITKEESLAARSVMQKLSKVINMLVNVQDSSPLPVANQLDKVLELLRTTELYSPQFPGLHLQNHLNDQVTTDLVSSLMSGPKSALRKMSHEVSSKGPMLPPTPTSHLPSLSTAPLNIKIILETEPEWNFEIFDLENSTDKRPLIWLGIAIFSRFDVCSSLHCDESTLQNWFSLIEANYHDNPYHNSTHAADVLQATAYFLQKLRVKNVFDGLDEAICLVAAVVHDVDHPGRNSAFLSNSDSQLAILYNDLSVLESHHVAKAFQLTIASEKANILKNMDRETYRAFRQSVIDMVLATEMTKHFEHINKFINSFEKASPLENDVTECDLTPEVVQNTEVTVTPELVVLLKRMLIKCADVSNPARPLHLCREWASRIAEEYCSQTDEEKRLGLPVGMPAFDRAICNIPKSQIGFMDYFVNDMFDAWDAFGNFPELIEILKSNYQYWKEQCALSEKDAKKIPKESGPVQSS